MSIEFFAVGAAKAWNIRGRQGSSTMSSYVADLTTIDGVRFDLAQSI